MSGLSETERAGFTKILSLMTTSDLLSLSDTVTNKMIVVENITGKTFIQVQTSMRKSANIRYRTLDPASQCCIPLPARARLCVLTFGVIIALTDNYMITLSCTFCSSGSSVEAQETILSFTKNAEELLRRKKVHRDLIFKYLVAEGVAMPPNSEKHTLIKRTLELWCSVKVM